MICPNALDGLKILRSKSSKWSFHILFGGYFYCAYIFSVRHDDKILFVGTTCTKFEFPTYKQLYWNIPPTINKTASVNSDGVEIRIEKHCSLECSIEQRERLRKENQFSLREKIDRTCF